MNRRIFTKILPLSSAALLKYPQKARSGAAEQESGALCSEYLKRVRSMLVTIKNNESDNLLEAAYHIAETVKSGGTCFHAWDSGHSTTSDLFPNRHGDPGIYTIGYNPDRAKKGDTMLISIIGRPLEDPRKKGVFVIGGPAPWAAETPHPELLIEEQQRLKYRQFCDIWIDTGISTHGAIIWLPGENVPMGAVSGALGLMTFWMITADVVRILARDGIHVKVSGDEPKVSGDSAEPYAFQPQYSKHVSLERPLGREYFNLAMKQLVNIEAELGSINRIADLIVDTILSGGNVFYYSRYATALCNEATNRRGGLLLNRGLYDNENVLTISDQHLRKDKAESVTRNDIVVMGIYQPDDPVDMKHLRTLRSIGAKVVSIGARSRDGIIPSVDTVPSLTDVHLGNMCNTYGLFAIPGVEKKVCPTSGLLVNQMHYAVQMQVAEKLIERTNNNPRIDANAAMEGGVEKRMLDFEIIRNRGY
ncbi:hypothetical protein ACFL6H_01245 [Candidatus Latescibacterota bacterium]